MSRPQSRTISMTRQPSTAGNSCSTPSRSTTKIFRVASWRSDTVLWFCMAALRLALVEEAGLDDVKADPLAYPHRLLRRQLHFHRRPAGIEGDFGTPAGSGAAHAQDAAL